jgi:hypothetical protein
MAIWMEWASWSSDGRGDDSAQFASGQSNLRHRKTFSCHEDKHLYTFLYRRRSGYFYVLSSLAGRLTTEMTRTSTIEKSINISHRSDYLIVQMQPEPALGEASALLVNFY